MRFQVLLPLAAALAAASGQVIPIQPPLHGIEKNAGQFDAEALFGSETLVFYRDRVQLIPKVFLGFANAGPAAPEGRDPLPVPLRVYPGSDPQRVFENVPHFGAVHYPQVYPGIDLDFRTDARSTGTAAEPGIRITIAPGADPKQIEFSLSSSEAFTWKLAGDSITVQGPAGSYYFLRNLAAYQESVGARRKIAAQFVQLSGSSFRSEPGDYDSSAPLIIEIGSANPARLSGSRIAVTPGDEIVQAGYTGGKYSYLYKTRPDGSAAFLTLFTGVDPRWIAANERGEIAVTGWPRSPALITANAPLPGATQADTWLGRFDAGGRIAGATFAKSNYAGVFALDPAGSVYFAQYYDCVISKWIPGRPQFTRSAPVCSVEALATNSTGDIAFVARLGRDAFVTPGAVGPSYEGEWTLYAGALDPLTGALRMASFVSVRDGRQPGYRNQTRLTLAPDGSLWIVSELRGPATWNTLVVLSADGKRILRSEGLPFLPWLALDSEMNVSMAGAVEWMNLPTTADAPVRAPCVISNAQHTLYASQRSTAGALLYGSYFNVPEEFRGGWILGFGGVDRFFLLPRTELQYPLRAVFRVVPQRPVAAQLACVISPATRETLTELMPGELVTISGSGLGPLEALAASAGGKPPLELAGVQVLLGGAAVPLAAVQQGTITFSIPPETPLGDLPLQVRSGGAVLVESVVRIANVERFDVVTADGSGRGPAAAINQDGTLNASQGARPGSVVSVFGIGTTPPDAVWVGISHAQVEYAGPAPALPPGVKQINLRIPQSPYPPAGDNFERLSIAPRSTDVDRPIYLRIQR